jgi:UDP-glucose 4-epimerase
VRILLTGICGFIGSHLAEAYIEAGHDVVGVDDLSTGRESNLAQPWRYLDVCDITERTHFYAIANSVKPDLVVHCAASYKDPEMWHRDTDVNVAGAINVAAVAKHHDAAIVYFQTVLPPISSYAISKIAGEHYLRLSGCPLTVYRLASVYGPRNLSGPIPTFYKRIKAGLECSVVTDVTRDFVFIGDLVDRVMSEKGSGTVDVRSGVETPIMALPILIGEALGVAPRIAPRPRPADDVAHYEMDGQPQGGIALEAGIARTVQWYEENGGVEHTYTHLKVPT